MCGKGRSGEGEKLPLSEILLKQPELMHLLRWAIFFLMALLSRLFVFAAMLENHYLYPVSDVFVPSLKFGTGVLPLCRHYVSYGCLCMSYGDLFLVQCQV